MESEQHPQSLPSKPSTPDWRRSLSQLKAMPFPTGDDEGGLELGQVVSGLRRRWPIILGVATVLTSAAFMKAINSTPIYQSGFEILIKPVTVESQVISSLPQTLSSQEQQKSTAPDQTTLKVLRSARVLTPIAEKLKAKYPGINYGALFSGLTITKDASAEILLVSFQNPNRNLVKDVIAELGPIYLNYSLEGRLADASQGIKFVEAQLPRLEKRVQGLQEQLQKFRQQHNLVDPDAQGKQLSEQLGGFNRERLTTQVQLEEARALYRNVQQQFEQLPTESVADAEVTRDPRFQKLLDRLLEIDTQLALDSTLFLEESNSIQVLKDQRENLIPLLNREAQRVQVALASRIRALEARNQALLATENSLNLRVKELSIISRQYANIQRELQIATENLNQFLSKREALRIDAGQKQTPWQLLSPPGEPIPSAANVKRTVMLGAIFGVLVGVGVALLLDRLDSIIYSAEEAKSSTKLPLLGTTPWIEETELTPQRVTTQKFLDWFKESPVGIKANFDRMGIKANFERMLHRTDEMNYYVKSPVQEAFRTLYTNIRLMNPDEPIRSLVITSSTPGDGKSTVAVNLAQSAAVMDQKVLLVDTDLRRPQLQNRLGLSSPLGLCDLMVSDLNWQQFIQQSTQEENLYILTAGQTSPDPIRTLSSQKFQQLMQQLEEKFDLVIYDTPPLVGLADATLVAAKASAMVLVVGLGKTERTMLSRAMDALKIPPTLILGIIANGSKDSGKVSIRTL
ncbi:MAG: polysaccharide biosynthesis tyrosine autokinase [Leptolyngbyaceae cyanobacterium bins.59]|nr:polysaccharide biosynthesis tyrosine autokinase [Leptolyngbyaceae cyanobacterium bins.59]